MEDRLVMTTFHVKDRTYYLFLCLDGHGGSEVVDYVGKRLPDILFEEVQDGYKTRTAIERTFEYLNRRVKQKKYQSGTTVSLFMMIKHPVKPPEAWLANVGDSSVFGVKVADHTVRRISRNHNVDMKGERARIEASRHHGIDEGYVTNQYGGLAMTRSIGDPQFGDIVWSKPDIFKLNVQYDLIMLASDGIWDVVDGRQLWERLSPPRERHAWRHSAHRLNAWRNETHPQHDNTCLILVYMDWIAWGYQDESLLKPPPVTLTVEKPVEDQDTRRRHRAKHKQTKLPRVQAKDPKPIDPDRILEQLI